MPWLGGTKPFITGFVKVLDHSHGSMSNSKLSFCTAIPACPIKRICPTDFIRKEFISGFAMSIALKFLNRHGRGGYWGEIERWPCGKKGVMKK